MHNTHRKTLPLLDFVVLGSRRFDSSSRLYVEILIFQIRWRIQDIEYASFGWFKVGSESEVKHFFGVMLEIPGSGYD